MESDEYERVAGVAARDGRCVGEISETAFRVGQMEMSEIMPCRSSARFPAITPPVRPRTPPNGVRGHPVLTRADIRASTQVDTFEVFMITT